MPLAVNPKDVEALVGWLRSVWLAGAGDNGAAGKAAAEEYARRHAGKLVGMSWDDEAGKWKQAKRQEYRIGRDVRDRINATVSEGIRNGDGVGAIRESLDPYLSQVSGRSLTVARTESVTTYNSGTVGAGAEAGVEQWRVHDGPGCMLEGHDDSAEAPSDEVGAQLDKQADGQVLTTEEAMQYVIAHPNCVRWLEALVT